MKRWFFMLGIVLVALMSTGLAAAEGPQTCFIGNGVLIFGLNKVADDLIVELVDGDTGEVIARVGNPSPGPIPGSLQFNLPPAMADGDDWVNLLYKGVIIDRVSLSNLLSIDVQPGESMSVNNCLGGLIGDGRINDGGDQLAAPLAGYCTDDDGIEVWDISAEGVGTKDFTLTADDILAALAAAKENDVNQLIGEGSLGNQLWALTSGELQFHGPGLPGEEGKLYDFVFAGDFCV